MLLMDEPLSNLDALLRLEMRAELKSVLREAGTTTIYVTHDQTEAMGLADRIAVLHAGRIQQIGAPAEVYAFPATTFVGGFVGSPPMNFLTLPVSNGSVQLGALTLKPPAGSEGQIVLGVRRGFGANCCGRRLFFHRTGDRAARTPHYADRRERRSAGQGGGAVGQARASRRDHAFTPTV